MLFHFPDWDELQEWVHCLPQGSMLYSDGSQANIHMVTQLMDGTFQDQNGIEVFFDSKYEDAFNHMELIRKHRECQVESNGLVVPAAFVSKTNMTRSLQKSRSPDVPLVYHRYLDCCKLSQCSVDSLAKLPFTEALVCGLTECHYCHNRIWRTYYMLEGLSYERPWMKSAPVKPPIRNPAALRQWSKNRNFWPMDMRQVLRNIWHTLHHTSSSSSSDSSSSSSDSRHQAIKRRRLHGDGLVPIQSETEGSEAGNSEGEISGHDVVDACIPLPDR